MPLPRLKINSDIRKISANENGDRRSTIDSIFFYEGLRYSEGKYARINGKLIDCVGDEIDAVVWKNNWRLSKLYDYEDKFVARIKGYKTFYYGEPQITINEIEPIPPSEDEYNELIKVYTEYKQKLSPSEKEDYKDELCRLINSINNKYYKRLLTDLYDNEMLEKFKEWTAAWERHHAFPGGLLVHTVNVAKKCDAIAQTSDVIDRDLLVTAALLHDIAKVKEYDGFPSKRRLYPGRLLYHAYMGAEMVAIQIYKYRNLGLDEYLEFSDFPKNLEIQLKHCILSHHGMPEYGAAVKPMLLEANILHMMDDADAKEQYYKERVVESKEFDANMPADKVRGFYDDFTKEFSYPTMHIQEYEEHAYKFEFEEPPEDEEELFF